MAYTPITPRTSMPGPNDTVDTVELYGNDSAEVYLDCSAGTGTACLIQKGPGGKWRQYGPAWTVDNSQAAQQPARIQVPRERWPYQVLVTGGPTIDAAYIIGATRGR